MGMSIDEAIKVLEEHHMWTGEPQEIIDVKVENSAMRVAIDTMRKYQMFQAKYVERLKADMVAMLTEIQLEIEEIEIDCPFGFEPVSKTSAFYEGVSASSKVIQQKINAMGKINHE